MKVEEYRDLISEVWDVRISLVSAATSHEQRAEALRLRGAVARLKVAACMHANERDRGRANNVVRQCELLLDEKQRQFREADANLARMAFGAEWK